MSESSDSLRLQLQAPADAAAHSPVSFRLRAENTTDRTLELYLRGREIAFDIVVLDERGGEVWRRLEGAVIPAILRLEPLAPGAALELGTEWDGAPPGDYTAHAELLTDGAPLRTPSVHLRLR
jgi:hypothetical protein